MTVMDADRQDGRAAGRDDGEPAARRRRDGRLRARDGDAMHGDRRCSRARTTSRRPGIVDPVLGGPRRYAYAPGTWGPAEVVGRHAAGRMGDPVPRTAAVRTSSRSRTTRSRRRGGGFIAAAAGARRSPRGPVRFAVSGGRTPWVMLAAAQLDLPWPPSSCCRWTSASRPDGDADRNLTHLRTSLLAHVPLRPRRYAMPVGRPRGGGPRISRRRSRPWPDDRR